MVRSLAKVLLLGNDTRSFLSCIRAYGRMNLEVHVAECSNRVVLKSKYITKALRLPNYKEDKGGWLSELHEYIKDNDYDLILPVNDSSILKIKEYSNSYRDEGNIYIQSDEVMNIVNDKYETYKLAQRLNISVAKSEIVESMSNLESIVEKSKFPIVLKPLASYTNDKIESKNHVQIIYDISDFRKIKDDIKGYFSIFKGVLFQEYFEGTGVGIEVITKNGEILFAFQHRRIHEPYTGGGSSYRKSESINNELLEDSKKIIKELNYTGVAMIEFRYNYNTNSYILIEINGRFWGSLPLAIVAGANFPEFLYRMRNENIKDFKSEYKTDLYCKNIHLDIGWKYQTFRRKRYVDLVKAEFLSFSRLVTLRERYDELAIDDLAVFKELVYQGVKTIFSRFRIKLYRKYLQIKFISRKNVAGIKASDRVLFLCYGNICRSPFSEKYRQNITDGIDNTKSCGHFYKDGRLAHHNTIKIGKEKYGLNLEDFRSTNVNQEVLDWADYIVCFDEKNYKYLAQNHKKYLKKVILMGAYDRNGLFIKDPYTLDSESYEKTIDRIADIIKNNMHDS